MKNAKDFTDGDTDAALLTTIHHESFLVKTAFDEFAKLGSKQVMQQLNATEQVRLYSAYSSFLHHLYELYIALFMRDQGDDEGFSGRGSWKKRDALITDAAHRIFSIIHERLLAGKGQGWESDISYYNPDIPKDFAKKFRDIRNCTAHAISERGAGETDLSDFYQNYHKYVCEMYRAASSYWGKYDISQLDMQAIGNFSVIVRK